MDYLVEFKRKLTPYRVTHLPDGVMYEFFRVYSDKPIKINRNASMDLAILFIDRSGKDFTLNYYSVDHLPQIVNLPIDKLLEAVDDLMGAGFK